MKSQLKARSFILVRSKLYICKTKLSELYSQFIWKLNYSYMIKLSSLPRLKSSMV